MVVSCIRLSILILPARATLKRGKGVYKRILHNCLQKYLFYTSVPNFNVTDCSGYPKDCVTPEQRQIYVAEYLEHEGIELDPEKITHNPGLRALAKLMLNSFWGKLRGFLHIFYCLPYLPYSPYLF